MKGYSFLLNNKEICFISKEGSFKGEIEATRELLASENNVDAMDIKIVPADIILK
jgi:hypothetical protein